MSQSIFTHEIIIYIFRFLKLKDIVTFISILKKRDIFWKYLFNKDFNYSTSLPWLESYISLYNEKNLQKTSIIYNKHIWNSFNQNEIYLQNKSFLFMIKLNKPIKKKGIYNIYLRIKIDNNAILKDLFIRKSEIPHQQILLIKTDYTDSSKFSINHIKYFKIQEQKNILNYVN